MKNKIQMRRAIARDVIKQLNAKQLVAECMTYTGNMMAEARAAGFQRGDSLQKYLLRKQRKPCTVCAIGAGIVAQVRLENKVEVGAWLDPHDTLSKYFTHNQVNALENVFENCVSRFGINLEQVNPETRLRFLWSYVARHPGFTAAQLYAATRKKFQ